VNPTVSIIIPTLNEAQNLPELFRRTAAALGEAGIDCELIVVDDGSTDGTPSAARELAGQYPIRVVERGRGAEGGLSGAVLAGFAEARGDVLAVMDADLQHPPEMVPKLVKALERGQESPSDRAREDDDAPPAPGPLPAEMVVGSRYVPGGSVAEKWGGFRKINSLIATWLARPFAGGVSDPMSGFFALPRAVFERGRHLSPLGYKILLELMCKCRPRPVAEVPIHFAERHAGQSKLTVKEQFRYLEHLSRLYDYTFPRASPITKFAIVVALAWLFGGATYAALLPIFTSPAAVAVGYAVAIGVAAVFHLRYVRTQRKFLIRPTPWRDFFVSALTEWITAVAVASYLAARTSAMPAWEMFLIPFAAATLVRYVIRKEFLLDVRGLRPEERLSSLVESTRADAAANEAATRRAAEMAARSAAKPPENGL
jgi:dolichol-phosphate mannosyltransferase